MKPLMSRTEDTGTLQDLGRASIQIVHDLKNQLNGLKLYATFLRKRIEKGDRPGDEHETISKLISGLDRAASDLSTIVEYGRDIELTKQRAADVQKVLRNICLDLTTPDCLVTYASEEDSFIGEFDPMKLADAFKWITIGAIKYRETETNPTGISVSIASDKSKTNAVQIKWSGLARLDHDPFRSFHGSDEIRMSLSAKIIEAHDGSVSYEDNSILVTLPLSSTTE